VGNAVDPAAHSRLVLPAAVEVQTWDPSAGSIAHLGGSMEWDLGELGHGESATCVIELRVGDDVLPGRSLELDATYSTGGEMASQMVTIQLPRALLPEAGSEP